MVKTLTVSGSGETKQFSTVAGTNINGHNESEVVLWIKSHDIEVTLVLSAQQSFNLSEQLGLYGEKAAAHNNRFHEEGD